LAEISDGRTFDKTTPFSESSTTLKSTKSPEEMTDFSAETTTVGTSSVASESTTAKIEKTYNDQNIMLGDEPIDSTTNKDVTCGNFKLVEEVL